MRGARNGAVAALVVIAAAGSPALAQSPERMLASASQCTAFVSDQERLACYDRIFNPDPDAEGALSVTLDSEQLIPARPTGRAPATITVSCEAGNLSVAFGFAGNTLSSLGRDVGLTLQYDLQRARSNTLPVSADNTEVLIDNSQDALGFLDGLAGATNLTARVTPANSRSLSVRFRVVDFDAQVAPVVAACS